MERLEIVQEHGRQAEYQRRLQALKQQFRFNPVAFDSHIDINSLCFGGVGAQSRTGATAPGAPAAPRTSAAVATPGATGLGGRPNLFTLVV